MTIHVRYLDNAKGWERNSKPWKQTQAGPHDVGLLIGEEGQGSVFSLL